MPQINSNFIEKYQDILAKDPDSKIFAPLAEAYRQMEMLDEAEQLCRQGVNKHPHFSGGLVTLGRILLQKKKAEEAFEFLHSAADLAPENILANNLLAEAALKTRRPKVALKAFKMVLFLNPNDAKATKAVQKLESLTADEYEEELFAISQANSLALSPEPDDTSSSSAAGVEVPERSPSPVDHELERALSLADAFIVRNDFDRAQKILDRADREFPEHAAIRSRLALLDRRQSQDEPTSAPAAGTSGKGIVEQELFQRKRELLEGLLHRINEQRIQS